MKRVFYLAFAVLIATEGAACSDSVSSAPEQAVSHSDVYGIESIVAYGTPDGALPVRPDPVHDLHAEFASLRASALKIIESDMSTSARDRRIRTFLQETKGSVLSHYVEQFAAVHLLRELLRTSEPAPVEGIEYYVNVLLRNGSPEASLLLEALTRLKHRWTPQRLAEVSRLSAEHALSWAERVCDACIESKSADGVPENADGRVARKVAAVTGAAERLAEMASP